MNERTPYQSDFPLISTKNLIDCIKNSTWEIDCPYMLLKSYASENPATYNGAGRISQSVDGHLAFKLYPFNEENTPKFPFINSVKPGDFYPDSELYELIATDSDARQWHSSHIVPSYQATQTDRTIVYGDLSEITFSGKYPDTTNPKGYTVQFWIFDNLTIPFNKRTIKRKSVVRGHQQSKSSKWNAWQFKCLKTEFTLIKEADDLLTIKVTNNESELPEYFDNRIIEALQFLLGRPIHWGVMIKRIGKNQEVVIRSRRSTPIEGQIHPPLRLYRITKPKTREFTVKYHKMLFHRFLKHILIYDRPHHPLWGKLNAILEARTASFIDAEALTLTISIEAVLVSEFAKLGYPSKQEKSGIMLAIEYFESWDGREDIKARIIKIVKSMINQIRAVDRMYVLNEKGAIKEDQIQTWIKLRNKTVHSYQTSKKSSAEQIQLILECQMLFYHLVFYAIDYMGPYTDYSVPGWPIKKYPERTLWV